MQTSLCLKMLPLAPFALPLCIHLRVVILKGHRLIFFNLKLEGTNMSLRVWIHFVTGCSVGHGRDHSQEQKG